MEKPKQLWLVFDFTGHIYCIKLFTWSLPAAVFILLGSGCCFWDIGGLIWDFFGISNLMRWKKIDLKKKKKGGGIKAKQRAFFFICSKKPR